MGRTLSHNHPSTSYLLAAPMIIGKQIISRTVAAMIVDRTWLWVFCVVNMLSEMALRMSVRFRDVLAYRFMFGRYLRAGENTLDLIENPRNRSLRAHTAMLESM